MNFFTHFSVNCMIKKVGWRFQIKKENVCLCCKVFRRIKIWPTQPGLILTCILLASSWWPIISADSLDAILTKLRLSLEDLSPSLWIDTILDSLRSSGICSLTRITSEVWLALMLKLLHRLHKRIQTIFGRGLVSICIVLIAGKGWSSTVKLSDVTSPSKSLPNAVGYALKSELVSLRISSLVILLNFVDQYFSSLSKDCDYYQ